VLNHVLRQFSTRRQGFGNSTVLAHFDGELPSLHCLLQGHRVMSMVAQKKRFRILMVKMIDYKMMGFW
jgi:hypothetical protein